MNSNQRRFSFSARALAALAVWFLLAGQSQATPFLTYDLRAVSGGAGVNVASSKSVFVLPGASGSINLEIWALINQGNDTNHADDAITFHGCKQSVGRVQL